MCVPGISGPAITCALRVHAFGETMPNRNLICDGSYGAMAFDPSAGRRSPKVARTCGAAARPLCPALSHRALEALLQRGTVSPDDAGSDEGERPLGRDRAHASACRRNRGEPRISAAPALGSLISSWQMR
jgi:hypothetical protein